MSHHRDHALQHLKLASENLASAQNAYARFANTTTITNGENYLRNVAFLADDLTDTAPLCNC